MSASPVSIHPYFKAKAAANLDAIHALLPKFVEKTATEPKALYYEFTVNGDEVFCREAYQDAEATLAHLENVGQLLGQMLELADLTRLEFHGPASEIDKLRGPLAHLNPHWFVRACGVEK